MGFCKSNQKSMPVVGLLTCNDCDVLRAKTGLYRRVTHRTIIPPTLDLEGKASVGAEVTAFFNVSKACCSAAPHDQSFDFQVSTWRG